MILVSFSLTSLCVIGSRFSHFTRSDSVCSLYCWVIFITHTHTRTHTHTYIYHNLFIHSPLDGHTGLQSALWVQSRRGDVLSRGWSVQHPGCQSVLAVACPVSSGVDYHGPHWASWGPCQHPVSICRTGLHEARWRRVSSPSHVAESPCLLKKASTFLTQSTQMLWWSTACYWASLVPQ